VTTPVLLSVDIDGVLHASDGHFVVADVQSSSADELVAAGLFTHRGLLADVLAQHPDVVLVTHSSWRLTHSLQRLRVLFGAAGARLMDVAPPLLAREHGIEALMARRRVSIDRLVIVDDVPQYFSRLRSRVVACNPQLGLPGIVDHVHLALRSAAR